MVTRPVACLGLAILLAAEPCPAEGVPPLYRRTYSPYDTQPSRTYAPRANPAPWDAAPGYSFAFPYGDWYGPRYYGFNRHFYGYRPYWGRRNWSYAARPWYGPLSGYSPYTIGSRHPGYPGGPAGWSPWWGRQGEYVSVAGSYYALPYGRPPFEGFVPFEPCSMPRPSGPVVSCAGDYYGYRPYQYDCVCDPYGASPEAAPQLEEPPIAPEAEIPPPPGPALPPT